MICEAIKRHKEAKICRFEDKELTNNNVRSDDDICNPECIKNII